MWSGCRLSANVAQDYFCAGQAAMIATAPRNTMDVWQGRRDYRINFNYPDHAIDRIHLRSSSTTKEILLIQMTVGRGGLTSWFIAA
jgi:hypothetical protein